MATQGQCPASSRFDTRNSVSNFLGYKSEVEQRAMRKRAVPRGTTISDSGARRSSEFDIECGAQSLIKPGVTPAKNFPKL